MSRNRLPLICLSFIATVSSVYALTGNWAVDADGGWNTPGNWSSNPNIPNGINDTANLNNNISGNRTVTLDVPVTLGTLLLQDSTTPFYNWTLSGANALTLQSSNSYASVTFAQGTANIINTDLVLNTNLYLNVNQGFGLTVNGNISGNYALYQGTANNTSGERGVLTLTGNNTFLGDFYSGFDGNVSYGPLQIGSDTALGAGAVHLRGVRVAPFGASRSLANAVSIEADQNTVASSYGLAFNGPATLTGNRSITVNNDSFALNGGVGQSGGNRTLTKAGAGFLIINGASTYSSTSTISAGVLRASDGIGLPSASLLQLRGGVLEMSNTFHAHSARRPARSTGTPPAVAVFPPSAIPSR